MRDRASRENRARRSGSFATAGSSTLIATSRPSLVSRARLDRAHTALAERGQDLERAEARAGRERRRCQRGEILVRKPPRSARAAHSTKSVSYAGMPVATDCYKAGWHRLPVATDSMPRRRARPRRSAPSLAVSTLVRTAIQVTLVSSVFRCASASGRETTRKHAVASSTKPSVPRSRYATTHRPARPHPPQHFTNAHVVGSLDSAAMVSIFTSDARILPPNADPVIGRPAIEPHVSDVDAPPLPLPVRRLSDRQIRDLFTVSQVEKRGEEITGSDGRKRKVTVDDWVRVFKRTAGARPGRPARPPLGRSTTEARAAPTTSAHGGSCQESPAHCST